MVTVLIVLLLVVPV